jgi:hypothetical protein
MKGIQVTLLRSASGKSLKTTTPTTSSIVYILWTAVDFDMDIFNTWRFFLFAPFDISRIISFLFVAQAFFFVLLQDPIRYQAPHLLPPTPEEWIKRRAQASSPRNQSDNATNSVNIVATKAVVKTENRKTVKQSGTVIDLCSSSDEDDGDDDLVVEENVSDADEDGDDDDNSDDDTYDEDYVDDDEDSDDDDDDDDISYRGLGSEDDEDCDYWKKHEWYNIDENFIVSEISFYDDDDCE